MVRRWNLFQMNLPVLFRTIDGTSQVTIETQYAARDFKSFRYGASRRLRFSFFKRQGPRFGRLDAFGYPAVFVLFNPYGPVAQLVRAHA